MRFARITSFLVKAIRKWLGRSISVSYVLVANRMLSFVRNRFLGRGCDEALFSEKKGFSVKRGRQFSE